MITKRIWRKFEMDVMFTEVELDLMTALSERHYDFRCKMLSQPGGLLYGMRNKLGTDTTVEWTLDIDQLDLLAKTCQDNRSLSTRLGGFVTELNELWREANTENLKR